MTGFIKFRPQLLFSQENEDLQRGWPSPRSWERVSTMLKIAEKNQRKSSLKYTIPGLIGQGAAAEFMAFYKNIYYMSDTVDIAECLKSGRTIPLPQKADLLHACCGAVAYQLKSTKDAKLFPVIAENDGQRKSIGRKAQEIFLATEKDFCQKLSPEESEMLPALLQKICDSGMDL